MVASGLLTLSAIRTNRCDGGEAAREPVPARANSGDRSPHENERDRDPEDQPENDEPQDGQAVGVLVEPHPLRGNPDDHEREPDRQEREEDQAAARTCERAGEADDGEHERSGSDQLEESAAGVLGVRHAC